MANILFFYLFYGKLCVSVFFFFHLRPAELLPLEEVLLEELPELPTELVHSRRRGLAALLAILLRVGKHDLRKDTKNVVVFVMDTYIF